jgi:hypothetical protein
LAIFDGRRDAEIENIPLKSVGSRLDFGWIVHRPRVPFIDS